MLRSRTSSSSTSRTSSLNFLGLEKLCGNREGSGESRRHFFPLFLPSLTFSLTSILSPSLSLRRGMFQKMCSSLLLQRVIEKQEGKRCVKSRRFLIFNSLYSESWRIWCILLRAVCFSWVRKVRERERGERMRMCMWEKWQSASDEYSRISLQESVTVLWRHNIHCYYIRCSVLREGEKEGSEEKKMKDGRMQGEN